MLKRKKALLLDMNGTFMFGHDRFGASEDFFKYYSTLSGKLDRVQINTVIRAIYDYLNARYSEKKFRHNFPSTKQALDAISDEPLEDDEIQKIVATFAHYEMGYVPPAYVNALHTLKGRFALGVVIDI